MRIFQRIITLIKGFFNFFLRKVENHNPQLLLDQALDDMQLQLNRCKKEVSEAIAQEKRLARQLDEQRQLTKDWLGRAQRAVSVGNDELAKEALHRKREHEEQAIQLKIVHDKQLAACTALKEKLRTFNGKIEEASRKRGVLIARHEAAEAHKQIAEAQSTFNNGSAFSTSNQMEDRIEELEAHAEATFEVSEEASGDHLKRKFDELDAFKNADDDLAALKASMGLAPDKQVRVDDTDELVSEIEEVSQHQAIK